MAPATPGVYVIRNTVSGSCYVGSAVNIKRRWATHKAALNNGGKAPPKLLNAWRKYGPSAFTFTVHEHCEVDKLLEREQFWIDTLRPKYNTRLVAESNLGIKWSPEINAKKGRGEVITYNGEEGTLRALVKKYAVVTGTCVRHRLSKGWGLYEALTTPAASFSERGKASVVSRKPRGRTYVVRGVEGTMAELVAKFSEHSGHVVRVRMARGMSLEEALFTPISHARDRIKALHERKGVQHPAAKVFTVLGETGSLKMLADKFGVGYDALLKRVGKYGWSLEKALTTPTARRTKKGV